MNDNYDDDHDSDLEARLYAQIYFDDSKINPSINNMENGKYK